MEVEGSVTHRTVCVGLQCTTTLSAFLLIAHLDLFIPAFEELNTLGVHASKLDRLGSTQVFFHLSG